MLAVTFRGRSYGRGFGQAPLVMPPPATASPASKPAESSNSPAIVPPSSATSTITLPVVPDNVAVRCRYDERIGTWRCGHGGLLEQPSTYVLALGAVLLLALGVTTGLLLPKVFGKN
jgi:hypothetical protein